MDPLRRSKNSSMPCLPGFLPVTSDTQAVGVIGGMVVSSAARVPRDIISSSFGILFSASADLRDQTWFHQALRRRVSSPVLPSILYIPMLAFVHGSLHHLHDDRHRHSYPYKNFLDVLVVLRKVLPT